MGDTEIGIVPCIVGSSYSVLVSEQLFVSSCEFLISITSSGIISEPKNNQRFALITESVRDEGTSYLYLPKEVPAKISESLFQLLKSLLCISSSTLLFSQTDRKIRVACVGNSVTYGAGIENRK